MQQQNTLVKPIAISASCFGYVV
uniref:Uncharacterized protein n=1 Tax=Arundo donax TaxID=35708 RepID=A0A0A9HCC7_ARUDO